MRGQFSNPYVVATFLDLWHISLSLSRRNDPSRIVDSNGLTQVTQIQDSIVEFGILDLFVVLI